jgi:GTP 3',8-cyclase
MSQPTSNASQLRVPFQDRFQRPVEKLRISLTDRCNFRCTYCMPAEGLPWLPDESVLSNDEILRLTHLFMQGGVTQVRLTGGEPLLRKNLLPLVKALAALPLKKLAMTTNATLLPQHAEGLYLNGLRSFNVSLDSLRPERFAQAVRRDALEKVKAGLQQLSALEKEHGHPCEIKINNVIMKDFNEDEVLDFAALARTEGWTIRFIEFMPLGKDDQWSHNVVVPGAELLERIHEKYPLVAKEKAGKNPASRWLFADGSPGEIGFINSVSEPFCAQCNRVRLTADGQLRNCLFSLEEQNVAKIMRLGANDDDIYEFISQAIWRKEAGHLINSPGFQRPDRTMSSIGG